MTTYDYIMIAWGFLFGGLMTIIILHSFSKKETPKGKAEKIAGTKQKNSLVHH